MVEVGELVGVAKATHAAVRALGSRLGTAGIVSFVLFPTAFGLVLWHMEQRMHGKDQ